MSEYKQYIMFLSTDDIYISRIQDKLGGENEDVVEY